MSETETKPVEPILWVERGNPSPEELAALVLVVAAAAGTEDDGEGGKRGLWANHARRMGVRPMAARRRTPQSWKNAATWR